VPEPVGPLPNEEKIKLRLTSIAVRHKFANRPASARIASDLVIIRNMIIAT
jgi:hypothetical protein